MGYTKDFNCIDKLYTRFTRNVRLVPQRSLCFIQVLFAKGGQQYECDFFVRLIARHLYASANVILVLDKATEDMAVAIEMNKKMLEAFQ